MKIPTIYELRKDWKLKVRVTHSRYLDRTQVSNMQKENGEWVNSKDLTPISVIRNNKWQTYINAKGGLTVIEATDTKGNNYKSQAKCSKKDAFNRKLAISIALGRLIKKFVLDDSPKL